MTKTHACEQLRHTYVDTRLVQIIGIYCSNSICKETKATKHNDQQELKSVRTKHITNSSDVYWESAEDFLLESK